MKGRQWLDAPSVEPRITVQIPEPGRINHLLRVPCPIQFPSHLEQAILKKFLAEFHFAPRFALPDSPLAHLPEASLTS